MDINTSREGRAPVRNIKYNFQNIFRFLTAILFLRLTQVELFSFKELPLSYFLYKYLVHETTEKNQKFELLGYLYLGKLSKSDLSFKICFQSMQTPHSTIDRTTLKGLASW